MKRVICSAPQETLEALRAIEGYRVRVLGPSSGTPYDLLELCRRNYEYRQSDLGAY